MDVPQNVAVDAAARQFDANPAPASRALVFADVTILASAAILAGIWAFLPKDLFGGVAAYLPFHMFVETFSIVVSLLIFGVVWNARSPERTSRLLILSCAMLAVGVIDFGHMLSVSGMPDFVTPSSPQKGIVFWLAARFTGAAGFLAAALLPASPLRHSTSRYTILAVFVAVAAATYRVALFHPDALPTFFVPGEGLTLAKVAAEYFIVAIQLVAAFAFWRRARGTRSGVEIAMYAAVSLSVLSEAYFTFYAAAHDLFQVLGHIYKIIAYGFLYQAVFVACVHEPFEMLTVALKNQKQAEATTRQLASIVESSDDAIISVTLKAEIATWNAGAERLFGYRAEEIIGRSAFVLVPPERAREENSILDRVRAGEHVRHYATVGMRKDGSIIDISLTVSPVRDDTGKIVGISKTGRDITDAKRAEERSRAASLYVRNLIEASLDPLVAISPDGKIQDVNKATEAATGASRNKLIGTDFADYFTEPNTARAGYQRVLKEGLVRDYPLTLRHASGSTMDVLYNAAVYRNEAGAVQGIFASARDVTERKLSEEALRRSEERFRALAEATSEGMLIHEAGRIVDLNSKMEELLDRPRTQLLGASVLDFVAPVSREMVSQRVQEPADKRVEFTFLRPDGSEVIVSGLAHACVHLGRPMRVAAYRDVTLEKRAEAEIRQLNATLEQRVLDRTAQLESLNNELEAFAYSVSHDLRAPLRSIDGFSKILEEDYADRVDDEGKDALHRVRAAAQRMGLLIDDLLQLSRLSRAEIRAETVDMSALAQSIAETLRSGDPARNVRFDIAPQVVARGDRRLIEIALENLLGNAWKFTNKHAGACIEFGVTEKDGEPIYFVHDDGAGFDMAHAANLFTAFQRLHSAAEFPGTGIGLATVRRIVQRHGGRVWAEGAVEKGATFYFTLGTQAERAHDGEGATAPA